jgi:hypothetical protein
MRGLLVMVMVLVSAACGASSPISIDEYAARGAQTVCEFQVKCGGARDMTDCLSVHFAGPTVTSATLVEAVKAGRARYDGDVARDCFDALGSRSCNVTTASYHSFPEVCLHVFQGTLHGGATCADGAECISGTCDIPACNMACCTGTCRGDEAPALASIGASCAINFCRPDAFCDLTSNTCLALKHLGESCQPPSYSCVEGLSCGSTKTCTPPAGPGEPCVAPGCRERGTRCSATTGTCVPVGLPGDPCSEDDDCSILYVCGANNQCSAGIALGAPCKKFDQCADAGAFCDVPDNAAIGTCTAPKPNGASCHGPFDCASNVCDPASGTCVVDVPCD